MLTQDSTQRLKVAGLFLIQFYKLQQVLYWHCLFLKNVENKYVQ